MSAGVSRLRWRNESRFAGRCGSPRLARGGRGEQQQRPAAVFSRRNLAGRLPVEHPVQVSEKGDKGHQEQEQHQAHQPGTAGGEASPEESHLRHEQPEGGQAADCQHCQGEEASGGRHHPQQPGNGGQIGGAIAVVDPPGEGEERGLGQAVVEPERSSPRPGRSPGSGCAAGGRAL